ncbi:MAG: polysaccharide deacetylase family protein [Deltaproteobacteria bacterium]|nr:polysaccharide deacetylase family protein [Deltaproteobacteria bacterium]
MSTPRILYQIASQRPPLAPPQGKPLIVHIVLNVENWRFDHSMPRKILPAPHGIERIPDVPNFTWAEYEMRCGFPRILGLLEERGLPASTSINASAIDSYPACAEAMRDAGWEFIGHGIHQRAVQAEDNEGELIAQALKRIENFTGIRPRGWLGPGLQETFDTPDLLKAAGIDYVCDWVLDDLPCWMTTRHGPLIAMPYSLEINDSVVYAVEKHSSPEMYQRLRDTLETFDRELLKQPRVLTLALHPHLIGVPHRIGYLARMLDHLQQRQDIIFMTGSQIADWFIEADRAANPKE